MEAKVINRFYGADNGKIYPRWFEVGEEISGDIAEAAIMAGDAVAKKKRTAPSADHKKQLQSSQQAQVSPVKTPKKRGRPRKQSS